MHERDKELLPRHFRHAPPLELRRSQFHSELYIDGPHPQWALSRQPARVSFFRQRSLVRPLPDHAANKYLAENQNPW